MKKELKQEFAKTITKSILITISAFSFGFGMFVTILTLFYGGFLNVG